MASLGDRRTHPHTREMSDTQLGRVETEASLIGPVGAFQFLPAVPSLLTHFAQVAASVGSIFIRAAALFIYLLAAGRRENRYLPL